MSSHTRDLWLSAGARVTRRGRPRWRALSAPRLSAIFARRPPRRPPRSAAPRCLSAPERRLALATSESRHLSRRGFSRRRCRRPPTRRPRRRRRARSCATLVVAWQRLASYANSYELYCAQRRRRSSQLGSPRVTGRSLEQEARARDVRVGRISDEAGVTRPQLISIARFRFIMMLQYRSIRSITAAHWYRYRPAAHTRRGPRLNRRAGRAEEMRILVASVILMCSAARAVVVGRARDGRLRAGARARRGRARVSAPRARAGSWQ